MVQTVNLKKAFGARVLFQDINVKLDGGKITSIEFVDRREEILEWIDAVIVINDQEYVWPFMDEGIIALVAPTQKSIDEVIEAFLFKDLHDFSI